MAHVAKEMGVSVPAPPVFPTLSEHGRAGEEIVLPGRVRARTPPREEGRGGPRGACEAPRRPGPNSPNGAMSGPTVSRIIARAGMPRLSGMDPISGERIRGRATTTAMNATPPGRCSH